MSDPETLVTTSSKEEVILPRLHLHEQQEVWLITLMMENVVELFVRTKIESIGVNTL